MGQGWDGSEEKEEKERKAAFRVCVQTKKKKRRPPTKETNHGFSCSGKSSYSVLLLRSLMNVFSIRHHRPGPVTNHVRSPLPSQSPPVISREASFIKYFGISFLSHTHAPTKKKHTHTFLFSRSSPWSRPRSRSTRRQANSGPALVHRIRLLRKISQPKLPFITQKKETKKKKKH